MLVSVLEASLLQIFHISLTHVQYQMEDKKKLPKLMYLGQVRVLVLSVFVEYEYLDHGGFGWRDS